MGKQTFTRRVTQVDELQQVLIEIGHCQQLAFIEVVLPPMDAPELLVNVAKSLQDRNTAT